MNSPRIRLVTRADDAGSCHSANEAIAMCCEAGVIRNVSFMAPGPAIAAAATLLEDRPDIDCGFHVVLNAEWDEFKWGPVLPPERVPSLVDANGHFLAGETRLLCDPALSADLERLGVVTLRYSEVA